MTECYKRKKKHILLTTYGERAGRGEALAQGDAGPGIAEVDSEAEPSSEVGIVLSAEGVGRRRG